MELTFLQILRDVLNRKRLMVYKIFLSQDKSSFLYVLDKDNFIGDKQLDYEQLESTFVSLNVQPSEVEGEGDFITMDVLLDRGGKRLSILIYSLITTFKLID